MINFVLDAESALLTNQSFLSQAQDRSPSPTWPSTSAPVASTRAACLTGEESRECACVRAPWSGRVTGRHADCRPERRVLSATSGVGRRRCAEFESIPVLFPLSVFAPIRCFPDLAAAAARKSGRMSGAFPRQSMQPSLSTLETTAYSSPKTFLCRTLDSMYGTIRYPKVAVRRRI